MRRARSYPGRADGAVRSGRLLSRSLLLLPLVSNDRNRPHSEIVGLASLVVSPGGNGVLGIGDSETSPCGAALPVGSCAHAPARFIPRPPMPRFSLTVRLP